MQPEALLFESPTVHDAGSGDPGFEVQLEGELEVGDNYWPAVLDATEWILEIDASARSVRYRISPTKLTQRLNPSTKVVKLSRNPIRIQMLVRSSMRVFCFVKVVGANVTSVRGQHEWRGSESIWRGLRVLPYGAEGDDWLSGSRDYSDRTRKLRFLVDSKAADGLEQVDGEGLSFPSNKNFVGAVFLTAERAKSLEMLVNREGFVPSDSFQTLVTLVRRGIDLVDAVRAAREVSPKSLRTRRRISPRAERPIDT